MLHKLWMLAKVQGHRNPFSPEVMQLTMPQIDFILEMAAADDPEHYSFTRGRPTTVTSALAAWHNIFEGGALQRFMASRLNLAVLQKRRAERKPPAALGLRGKGLKNGFALDADGTGQGRKPDRS